MKKRPSTLFVVIFTLATGLVSAGIMQYFKPETSWLAFFGWVIFFASITAPWFYMEEEKSYKCRGWFRRFFKTKEQA